MENQEKVASTEIKNEQSKVQTLDDFFAGFETNILKPNPFPRPKEGEACEACSG
jgi:hypothetical protein